MTGPDAKPWTFSVDHDNLDGTSHPLGIKPPLQQHTMAPTASFTAQSAGNGKTAPGAAKNGQSAGEGRPAVHLTSSDIIELEHQYGAHK